MDNSPMVVFEKEMVEIFSIIENLNNEAHAKACFLVDKNGQLIASTGNTKEIDSIGLASLTAGNFAATAGIAKLLGEKEFSIIFHEGEKDNIHLSLIDQRIILVVLFDSSSSLGLVRLRVKKFSRQLGDLFNKLASKADPKSAVAAIFEEISDQDIDQLFGD